MEEGRGSDVRREKGREVGMLGESTIIVEVEEVVDVEEERREDQREAGGDEVA